MGWSYRKSVGLGPFRINISKSGIGYSVGGRGFRTGVNSRGRSYKSFSVPGTGMRYYSSSSKQGCLVALALLVAVLSGIGSLTTYFLLEDLSMKLIRTFRTMTSERFLVQKKEGQDSAAIDLHYLADGHVAGTVFLFEHAGIEDAEVPEFLRHIDEALLPWVSLEDRTLTFTVVRGHVVGDFRPDKGEA